MRSFQFGDQSKRSDALTLTYGNFIPKYRYYNSQHYSNDILKSIFLESTIQFIPVDSVARLYPTLFHHLRDWLLILLRTVSELPGAFVWSLTMKKVGSIKQSIPLASTTVIIEMKAGSSESVIFPIIIVRGCCDWLMLFSCMQCICKRVGDTA